MRTMPAMVDMRIAPKESADDVAPAIAPQSQYPWGLRISLSAEDLAKAGLDDDDIETGCMIHLNAFAVVTNVNKPADQPIDRVELQITHLAAEDEDEEAEEGEDESITSRLYKSSE